MTKAERIFKATYRECVSAIDFWGNENNGGFHHLICEENDHLCKRTFNDIQHFIDSRIKITKLDYKLGVIDEEKEKQELNALELVQKTLNNTIKNYTEYGLI